MLLPALSQAREKARQAVCMNNLKQIGLAMAMYTQDWDEYFVPNATSDSSSNDIVWTRNLVILGYIPGKWPSSYTDLPIKVYHCPSLRVPIDSPYFIHYGYNWLHVGGGYRYDVKKKYIPAKLSQIRKPSETILLVDGVYYLKSVGAPPLKGCSRVHDYYGISNQNGYAHARHSSGLNVCWVDGHVSYVKVADPNNPYNELGNEPGQEPNTVDTYWDRN